MDNLIITYVSPQNSDVCFLE